MAELYRFGAIVLAAGLSSRMGGPNKLLTAYRGEPLATHTFKTVSLLGLQDCAVVTGRDEAQIEALALRYRLRCVHNSAFADGMGGSIAAGAASMTAAAAGVFIVLADMPAIGVDRYKALAEAFVRGAIAVPTYGRKRGHPVLFCSSYLAELGSLRGDTGARTLFTRHAHNVIEVTSPKSDIISDFDTPDDFTTASISAAPDNGMPAKEHWARHRLAKLYGCLRFKETRYHGRQNR